MPLAHDETAAEDTSAEALMTIGEVAREFGMTLRALRFYEAKRLIKPERHGATRLYGRHDRERITLILTGRRLGFTLAEIRGTGRQARRRQSASHPPAMRGADQSPGTTKARPRKSDRRIAANLLVVLSEAARRGRTAPQRRRIDCTRLAGADIRSRITATPRSIRRDADPSRPAGRGPDRRRAMNFRLNRRRKSATFHRMQSGPPSNRRAPCRGKYSCRLTRPPSTTSCSC